MRQFKSKKGFQKSSRKIFGSLLRNKKGIEMSINIIVMLVIGLTILGLVIGFVQGMFSDLDENIGGYQSEQDIQMLERVKGCNENPCVLPSPSVSVKVGQTKNLFVKLRSSTSDKVEVSAGPLPKDLTGSGKELSFVLVDSKTGSAPSGTPDYSITGPGFNLEQGNEDSQMYIFNSGKLPVGTYFATFSLTEKIESDPTETKVVGTATLTINVE